jgi:hypothetical protein
VPVDADQLRAAATQSVLGMGAADQPGRPRSAHRGGVSWRERRGAADKGEMELEQAANPTDLRFLPYSLPAGPRRIPWLAPASTYQALFAMARELGVSACAVIGFDLAALQTHFLGPMMAPVLESAANSPCRSMPWESSTAC